MGVDGDDHDDGWEICNDNGFVYKRRRRLADEDEDDVGGPRPPQDREAADEADLRRHRRARRRRCLLDLRERYRAELAQWERLSSSLHELATPVPTVAAAAAAAVDSDAGSSAPQLELPDACDRDRHQALFDDLLAQAETQERSLQKLSELCYYVESLCKEKEETLLETLLDLPIWGSPRTLMNSLSLD